MDILEQIIETKRQELSFGKRRSLKQALLASETGIIAGPVLVYAFCNALGGDYKKAAAPAAAIEMIHTFSLR